MILRYLAPALALVFALAPLRAHAQDDEFGDDDSGESTPRKHHHRHHYDDSTDGDDLMTDDQPDPSQRDMARMDDPRVGLGAELSLSLAMIDKSAGPGVTGVASFGFRANWAPGFIWTEPEDAFWREALLLEFSYDHVGYFGGTSCEPPTQCRGVNAHTGLHYLNLHAMFGWPVRHVLLLYGALGPGMTVEKVGFTTEGVETPLTGIKFNLAYGLGARLNLQVNPHFAFVSRLELMRYRRGYMNDTFFTLTLGGAF